MPAVSITLLAAATKPDLRFFQAAATIIPLLVLAIVFQARTAEQVDPTDHPLSRLVFIFMVATIGLITGGTTLHVLATGQATATDARGAAWLLVVLAGMVMLGPLLVELKRLYELTGRKHPVIVY